MPRALALLATVKSRSTIVTCAACGPERARSTLSDSRGSPSPHLLEKDMATSMRGTNMCCMRGHRSMRLKWIALGQQWTRCVCTSCRSDAKLKSGRRIYFTVPFDCLHQPLPSERQLPEGTIRRQPLTAGLLQACAALPSTGSDSNSSRLYQPIGDRTAYITLQAQLRPGGHEQRRRMLRCVFHPHFGLVIGFRLLPEFRDLLSSRHHG